MALKFSSKYAISKWKKVGVVFAVLALLIQPLVALNIPSVFALAATEIYTVSDLRTAIKNQADGQTWNIHPGTYGLSAFSDITTQGQTGWYFPITANHLTINGIGNPTIYGQGYTANGSWSTQDFVAVFGNNVTINGLTLMPKIEPNKTVEVIGSDFTLANTTITPNTIDTASYASLSNPTDAKWGGSLYFNGAGNHTVQNVTINNAGVSFRYSPSGTHLNFSNVKIINTTSLDWINSYRYSSGFNNSGNSITGSPSVEYHVNSTLNNLDSALASLHAGDTLALDSDITISKQVTIKVSATINGNGHTISPNFTKTDNGNNAAIGIQSNNVTINNLVEDGTNGTNLHGINVFASTGVALNDVTANNNDRSGVSINGSTVSVNNITTSGNGWHGINVDKPGAVLTVNGISHQTDTLQIYVDNSSIAQVIDTNNQYASTDNVLQPGDRVYSLKPAVPANLRYESPARACGTVTNVNYAKPAWDAVDGAVSYDYQALYNGTVVYSTNYATNQHPGGTFGSGQNGQWAFQVRSVNAAGIKSAWSTSCVVTLDTVTPPAPSNVSWKTSAGKTITSNGATNVYDGSAQWQDATPSDVNHYVYKYWNAIPGNPYKVGSEYVTTTTSTSMPGVFNQGAGTHYFCIAAVDAAGNTSSCTTLTVIYDTTAPTITVKAGYVGDQATKTYSNVSFSLYDANKVDKYVLNGWTSDFSNNNWSDANFANFKAHLVQGSNTLTLYDAAGNSTAYVFTYDSTAPTVVITSATRQTDGSYVVSGTSTDNSPVTVVVDGLMTLTATPVAGAWTATTATLVDGAHTVTASSTDAAGNTGTATPAPYTFTATTPIIPAGNTQGTTGGATTNGAATAPQFFAAAQQTPDITATDQAVLGAQDTSSSDTSADQAVKGASDTKATDSNAGKLFGLAWYWWLIILAVIIALWWIIAAARRRNSDS